MRNRVVHVQQIERRLLGDFAHLGGERQGVRRVIEQRIRGDFDFVEKYSLARAGQPDRHRVADEMHFVPARGQLDAQLGGDHARSAIRWIAGDSDFHVDCRTGARRARWTRE